MIWLEQQYINQISYRLENFRQVRENPDAVYNFRCVICGDSSNKRKAKAYIYEREDRFFYHCHLCGYSRTFYKFLEEFDPTLHAEYVLQRMEEEGRGPRSEREHIAIKSQDTSAIIAQKQDKAWLDSLFPRLSDLPIKSPFLKYARMRQIPETAYPFLYACDNTKDLEQLNPDKYKTLDYGDPRIVFPGFDKDGVLLGVTARSINNSPLRYVAISTQERMPVIFGLNTLETSRQAYVVEGPLDRLFLPNALAAGGSALKRVREFVNLDKTIFCFDNTPRAPAIIKIMKLCLLGGFTLCIWPNSLIHKDINEMILAGFTSESIVKLIESNAAKGLGGLVQLETWAKVQVK